MAQRTKVWLLLALMAVFASVTMLPFVAQAEDSQDLNRIVKNSKIIVGMELGVAVRSFMNTDTKKPDGMEVDLVNEFCKRIGVKAEIVDITWDGLIPALVSGRIDTIISGMCRKELRTLTVDFSDPEWILGQGLACRKDDNRFTTWESANKDGIKAGCTLGGIGEDVVKTYLPKAKLMTFPSYNQTALALIAKQIDVWIDDDFLQVVSIREHSQVKCLPVKSKMAIATGWAVRKGSDLLPVMNNFLYNAKSDGTFDRIVKKWDLSEAMNVHWDPLD